MSTVVDESSSRQSSVPAERLRATMAAMRVSFRWLGIRKSLTNDQKSVAADVFGAEGKFLSVGKKLLDNRHPAFNAVTATVWGDLRCSSSSRIILSRNEVMGWLLEKGGQRNGQTFNVPRSRPAFFR